MSGTAEVIDGIRQGFARTTRPAGAYLIPLGDGCEREEIAAAFENVLAWDGLDPAFLDHNYAALSLFSEAGFRFFLPAYLIADVLGRLKTADPVFHLTQGFHDTSVDVPVGERTFTRRIGSTVLINPQRYGAIRWRDHAAFRLAVFTREEARAIVVYLRYRHSRDSGGHWRPDIEAALRAFWLDRAEHAPTADELDAHLAAEEEFIRSIDPGSSA